MELQRKDVPISATEITYLAKKFIVYLALAHKESRMRIVNFMNRQGGYILHLDATCDGDSPHLMTGLDGISEIVLENIKLPPERADKIIPFLREVKELYGEPLALVHDMGGRDFERCQRGISRYSRLYLPFSLLARYRQ